MFDRVLGLPAHPLLVHAAVVLVPLLALGGTAYAVAPFVRRHVRWPLMLLALATPAAVGAAKLSGDAFRRNGNLADAEVQDRITEHKEFGDLTLWLVLALAVVVLLLTFAAPGRRADRLVRRGTDDTLVNPPRRRAPAIVVQVVLAVVIVGLAAVSLFYVFKTGDSGAHMVWDGF